MEYCLTAIHYQNRKRGVEVMGALNQRFDLVMDDLLEVAVKYNIPLQQAIEVAKLAEEIRRTDIQHFISEGENK